jgi:hypothetical protein
MIVDGLQPSCGDVLQQGGHAALAFAGIERDAEIERGLQLRRRLRQHRQATADMEPPDHHRQIGGAELPREVEGTGILIRLHPHQGHESGACGANPGDRAFDVDDRIALVIGVDLDLDLGAQDPRLGAFGQEAVDARQAVGGNGRAAPLNDIALLVVMRGLDQDNLEPGLGHVASPRKCPPVRNPAIIVCAL